MISTCSSQTATQSAFVHRATGTQSAERTASHMFLRVWLAAPPLLAQEKTQ